MIGGHSAKCAPRCRHGSFEGPSVPEDFRLAAMPESSRSHEWRQKLMRLVVGNARGAGGSRGGSRDGSPSVRQSIHNDHSLCGQVISLSSSQGTGVGELSFAVPSAGGHGSG